MSESNTDKRLERLAKSGLCSGETAPEYTAQLEELADKNMSLKSAAKKKKLFKALADSTRLRILGLLMTREMCVCEVMAALRLTQPTASHHLRILQDVGLTKDRKEGKWVFYSLPNPALIKNLLELDI
jgi:DNA-binding transcriptional ArsR family regulator